MPSVKSISYLCLILYWLCCFQCANAYRRPRKRPFLILVEGDMLYRVDPFLRIAKRNKQWINATVPYIFGKPDNYIESEKMKIREAMDYIESVSCVRFVKRIKGQKDYVAIRAERGCKSEVGRQGEAQELYLDTPFCMSKGKILHELLHTLGFVHEQSRFDRDSYVRVNFENVKEGKQDNFQKYTDMELDHLGEPYDFRSVMHYTVNEFSRNPQKKTLMPLEEIDESALGEGKIHGKLSTIDIRKINKYYKCENNKMIGMMSK